jgi:tetratricopeptide (TPR) repeat protein
MGEALREAPGSIKDLYRLGVFEAQLESRHDKVALRVFLRALEAHRLLEPAERERRHDLRKYVARCLYAAARSALRLGQVALARRLSFACVRDDEGRDHVEPVHKLGLAAKVCLVGGELDLAERAARKALDSRGPPRRDHLFGLLAEIAAKRGDLDGALGWIDGHVRPERRTPALWRQVGDIREARGELDRAEAAWRTSLSRDRAGKHLTLVRIARLERGRGRLREAERACHDALEFRRRKYLSEDPAALEVLGEILAARGKLDEAKAVQARLAKCGVRDGVANDTEEVA